MKRSKALLAANLLSTLYSAFLIWTFGGIAFQAGNTGFVETVGKTFEFILDALGGAARNLTFLYVVLILLFIHIGFILLGCLFGWIAYACKKSGLAKFAATLYLLATICFPLYFIAGLPITIMGYVGGGKQKKINKSRAQQEASVE